MRRQPVFWGPGSLFRLIDGPNGSRELLIGRSPTDGAHLAILNSRAPGSVRHAFNSVPPGATFVGGWASQNRSHLFYDDLDGDGTRELVSEINGTWNRVTVWRADGTALHDTSFGPGDSIPARNMRALDVADLDGDGKKEILAATSRRLVVALDCRCRKVWVRRLPSPQTVMRAATPPGSRTPSVAVGCEDGTVLLLDGRGTPVRRAKVDGVPARIDVLEGTLLLGTGTGEVRGLRL